MNCKARANDSKTWDKTNKVDFDSSYILKFIWNKVSTVSLSTVSPFVVEVVVVAVPPILEPFRAVFEYSNSFKNNIYKLCVSF